MIEIEFKRGEVIKPDSWKVLNEEGMPVKEKQSHGNLYIKFEVDFPDKFD